jgi:hypothetical protein
MVKWQKSIATGDTQEVSGIEQTSDGGYLLLVKDGHTNHIELQNSSKCADKRSYI